MAAAVKAQEESCLTRYRRIIVLIKLCARICGADITEPNYRMTWLTYIVIGLIFAFYCGTLYTIWVGVVYNNDWSIILQATCFVGGAVEGNTKLFCFIAQRKAMMEVQSFLDDTFLKYEQLKGNYRSALLKNIAVMRHFIRTFVLIYLVLMCILILFPFTYYAIYNEKIMIMQFLLPGIDPNTPVGYLALSIVHICCLLFGAIGNFAGDMYLFVFIINLPLLKDILSCKMENLNELLQQQSSGQQLRACMVDIVQWHQQYLSLLERTQRISFIIIFVQVFASALNMICTLYCMHIGVWPAAPAYLCYSMLGLYLFCGLGTFVEKSNEDCCLAIYTDCLWYKLPLPEQRMLLIMLHKSQTTENLSVGNMLPLTMSTALQVSKTVYSMLMLLLNNDKGQLKAAD